MESGFNSHLVWVVHLLTQVVLTFCPSCVLRLPIYLTQWNDSGARELNQPMNWFAPKKFRGGLLPAGLAIQKNGGQ
jgi:hypothetical protein